MSTPPRDSTTIRAPNLLLSAETSQEPSPRSNLDGHSNSSDSSNNISDPLETPKAYSFNQDAAQHNVSLHDALDSLLPSSSDYPSITTHRASPLSSELHLQTDFESPSSMRRPKEREATTESVPIPKGPQSPPDYRYQLASAGSGAIPMRTSSVRSLTAAHFTGGSLSPASAMSSPGLGPLQDITPLPSPLGSQSGSWANLPAMPPAAVGGSPPSAGFRTSPESITFPRQSPPRKRKPYVGLVSGVEHSGLGITSSSVNAHSSPEGIRITSDYHPATMTSASSCRPRHLTEAPSSTSHGSAAAAAAPATTKSMQREHFLAVQRGIQIAVPAVRPPTPPRSNQGATDSSESGSAPSSPKPAAAKVMNAETYEARTVRSHRLCKWAPVRQLGTGTFSTVMLATSDLDKRHLPEEKLDARSLVAVKICEHGPAGGADEKKIESSLKRELEILKAIDHPSLVHLRAVNVLDKRAYLVLNYSAGGDLFELASLKLQLLTPPLVRRIFAELVAAVRYLHEQWIVHRDIKLENILVDLTPVTLEEISPLTHPHPIITLTDLGLGRYIPQAPASPLLNTRCGSEDYAAPELLMGQEYDGRQTDAWALGVTLYAIMEGCLPFDPLPGARRQSPTSHRIARCEWSWRRWAGADGEWDEDRGADAGFQGARQIVEGLLKRVRTRWTLEKIKETEWVRGGISVDGGLKRREGDLDGDEMEE